MIVTEPLCNDDFWTSATRHVQMLARAMVKRMYLRSLALNKLLLRSSSDDWLGSCMNSMFLPLEKADKYRLGLTADDSRRGGTAR